MSRPLVDYRTASKEAYDKFQDIHSDVSLSFEDYKKIIYTYNSLIVAHMLETGSIVKLPYGLGPLVINKYKPKRYRVDPKGIEHVNLPIDWKATKEIGKRVYHLNAHTEGYKYYFMWNWWKSRIKFAYIWKFEMARVNGRLLKTYLKKPNSKYKDLYKEYPRLK